MATGSQAAATSNLKAWKNTGILHSFLLVPLIDFPPLATHHCICSFSWGSRPAAHIAEPISDVLCCDFPCTIKTVTADFHCIVSVFLPCCHCSNFNLKFQILPSQISVAISMIGLETLPCQRLLRPYPYRQARHSLTNTYTLVSSHCSL